MAAPFQGSGGGVSISGSAIAQVKGWSYSGLDREILDATVLGNTVKKKELSELLDPGTATADLLFDYAGKQRSVIDAILTGSTSPQLQVDLTVSGSSVVSGSALAHNLSITNSGNEFVAASCDFEFTDSVPIITQPPA